MPETTVNEDRLTKPRQNNVRSTGQIAAMQSEAVTHGVQHASYGKLGRRVLAAYSSHKAASYFGREAIGHLMMDGLAKSGIFRSTA